MKQNTKFALGAIAIFMAGGIFATAILSTVRTQNTEATLKDDIYRYAGVTTTEATTAAAQQTTASAPAAESAAVSVNAHFNGNPWSEGNYTVQEVELAIKNNSSSTITDWTGSIVFDTPVKALNSWNDTFTYDGKSVKIVPVEWNREIKPSEEKKINFHLKTEIPAKITDAKLTSDLGEFGLKAEDAKPAEPVKIDKPAADGSTPVGTHGKLSVKGTQIVDKNGDPVILQGVSTHGIAWFPQYINLESFRTLRDKMGVNTVRLALYSSQGEGYNTSLHQKVDEGVKYASELGMYVIIDWHILANGNPNTDKEAAKAFFKEMTGKYKDFDNVIYEICNEPNGGTSWDNDIKPYAAEMIDLIREQDDDAIIIVGTPTWSQDVDVAAKNPITGRGNIMYALHFYAATHKQDLRNKLAAAINAGLPVIVSEFGISEASGSGGIDESEANTWINYLRSNGISYVCWALSNKDESCSLISSSCVKTSDWSDDELAQEGRWLKSTYNAQ